VILPLAIGHQVAFLDSCKRLHVGLHIFLVLLGILLQFLVLIVLTIEAVPKHAQNFIAKRLRENASLLGPMSMVSFESRVSEGSAAELTKSNLRY